MLWLDCVCVAMVTIAVVRLCKCCQELDALAEQLNNLASGRDALLLHNTAPIIEESRGEGEEEGREDSDEEREEAFAEDGTLLASESSGPQ